jgi:hypothetical protein
MHELCNASANVIYFDKSFAKSFLMGFQHFLHKSPCLDVNHAAYNPCWYQFLSGSYKGVCWSPFNDKGCFTACKNDSADNTNGYCQDFKCWCEKYECTSETEAIASTPIQQ